MSSMTAAKLGWGWCRKTTRRGMYVRKKGSDAYAYLSSKLVLLDHEGYSVKSEGIDGQARGGARRPVYVKCTHTTRFL